MCATQCKLDHVRHTVHRNLPLLVVESDAATLPHYHSYTNQTYVTCVHERSSAAAPDAWLKLQTPDGLPFLTRSLHINTSTNLSRR